MISSKILNSLILLGPVYLLFAFPLFSEILCNDFQNESYENVTNASDYEILRSFPNTSSDIVYNLTDINFNQTDLVVTEDWENSEKSEYNQRNLAFTTSDEDICSCDLNSNVCDINCCCDTDCSKEDVEIFSHCHYQTLTADPNYCYPKDIIFRNNTVFIMEKDPTNKLFCIVHDNLRQHLRYKELPHLKSRRDLGLLLKHQFKNIHSWDEEEDTEESHEGKMKAGSVLYISEKLKKTENQWVLPDACFSKICSCKREVHYLENFKSVCSRVIKDLEVECKSNLALSADFFSKFCINPRRLVIDPPTRLSDLVAHTKTANLTDERHAQGSKLCVEAQTLSPNYSKNTCSNIVRAAHFTVIHDGSKGIQSISAEFEYVNQSGKSVTFLQNFSVDFKWNNVTDTTERSGNPGYHIGLPILVGTNSSGMEMDDLFAIEVQPGGLSVLERDSNNICSPKERKSIKFGKNFLTSCFYKLTTRNCTILQQKIRDILLGPSGNHVFVGIFGNANDSNIDDWIEVYFEEHKIPHSNQTCSLVTGIRIDVVYAAVGTVMNPQYKILGVGYHDSKPQVTDLSYASLMLSTSVSFFDVTEPAIAHYPKVPSIKANLPSDFFYPFLNGKESNFNSNIPLVIFACILVFL